MRRLLFIVVMFPVLVPLSCHSKPRHVVIGVALTSSTHSAVELAVKEINDSGGISGVPIELMGLDWKVFTDFEPSEIIKWSNRFADTPDLLAVIGHGDSASTLSAAAIYNQRQVPQIVTIATNPAITNIGGWTYRLCPSDVAQGMALAQYAVKDWGKKSFAIFYVNDAYGRGLSGIFQNELRALGATVLTTRMHRNTLHDDDKETIRATLVDLKKTGAPDVIVLFQRGQTAAWTINAIREAGLNVDVLGGDSLGEVALTASLKYEVPRIRVSQFYSPSPQDSRALSFVDSYRAYARSEPDYGHAFAYDAVYLLRDAIAKRGFSREAIKGYLDSIIEHQATLNGVGGSYVLGPDHDARRNIYILEAHKHQYLQLKSLSPEETSPGRVDGASREHINEPVGSSTATPSTRN